MTPVNRGKWMERLSAMFRAKRLLFGQYFQSECSGSFPKNRLLRAVRLTFDLLGVLFLAGLVIMGIHDHQTGTLFGMGSILVCLVLLIFLVSSRNPAATLQRDLDFLRQQLEPARDRVQKVSDLIDEKLKSGLLSRIVMNPGADVDGQPSLRDTKVPLEIVQEVLGAKYSESKIRDIIQSLEEKNIQAVLCFAYILLIERYSSCQSLANATPEGVVGGPPSDFSRVGEER